MQEVADALGTPKRTIERDFSFGRAWLHRELSSADSTTGDTKTT